MTRLFLLCCLALVLAGCASHHGAGSLNRTDQDAIASSLDEDDAYLDEAYDTQVIPDPLEGWNRAVFAFNDGLITYVARPVNTAYVTVTPTSFREGFNNFFTNLLFPVRFINCLLQGKGYAAALEFDKFIINTTVGLGGFVNYTGLNHPELASLDNEDFGQTLGVWGCGEGFYLYWPLLGPSNARDTVGMVGNFAMNPVTWIRPWWASWGIAGFRTINELDGILDLYDEMTKASIEPYTAVRDAYTQYRRSKIAK